MLILRFDFRLAPHATATRHELFSTALDMAEWAERHGALTVMFNEHHSADDGYLPSPLVMAAAAAARTSTVPISCSALLALLYDPVKLAEDMITLDHLSGGRVSYTIGLGYRDAEYEMFGVERRRRGALMDEHLDVLRRALSGERFSWRGRTVEVRPLPFSDGGPLLAYGGNSPAAARRAARNGMLLFAEAADPDLARIYDDEATAAGTMPGMAIVPSAGSPTSVFVTDDVDAAWAELGPFLLHDARAYAAWMGPDARAASYSPARSVDELRAEAGPYRIVTPAEAVELVRTQGTLSLQPLCGGLDPETAWRSLRLIETDVLPALA
ncbi:MAG: LLM class flavin-dependent oxidoreductase [Acidimicrobiales bacterium]